MSGLEMDADMKAQFEKWDKKTREHYKEWFDKNPALTPTLISHLDYNTGSGRLKPLLDKVVRMTPREISVLHDALEGKGDQLPMHMFLRASSLEWRDAIELMNHVFDWGFMVYDTTNSPSYLWRHENKKIIDTLPEHEVRVIDFDEGHLDLDKIEREALDALEIVRLARDEPEDYEAEKSRYMRHRDYEGTPALIDGAL